MSSETEKPRVKFSDIMSSKGMEYLNRAHGRTFTLNIFIGNTEQLLRTMQGLTDPMEHWTSIEKPESMQVLREVVRFLHNFLAGAMTLVDHTRLFVDDYYVGTSVKKEFTNRVSRTFTNNPTTRFIQDLRNYMVHCGPLPVERILTITPTPKASPGTGTAETGFFISKTDLQRWNNWKKESRSYLANAPEQIGLLVLVEEYRSLILAFHKEFDDLLLEHHKGDLELMTALRNEFDKEHIKS